MKMTLGIGLGLVVLMTMATFQMTTTPSPTISNSAIAHDSGHAHTSLKPVEESMHEFMEYVYQPTYKRLKTAMAAEPANKAGWKSIKAESLVLAESANLLIMRTPKEDGKDWATYAAATRSTGGALYQAARKKDYAAAQKSYKAMLLQCNACHKKHAEGKYQLTP